MLEAQPVTCALPPSCTPSCSTFLGITKLLFRSELTSHLLRHAQLSRAALLHPFSLGSSCHPLELIILMLETSRTSHVFDTQRCLSKGLLADLSLLEVRCYRDRRTATVAVRTALEDSSAV